MKVGEILTNLNKKSVFLLIIFFPLMTISVTSDGQEMHHNQMENLTSFFSNFRPPSNSELHGRTTNLKRSSSLIPLQKHDTYYFKYALPFRIYFQILTWGRFLRICCCFEEIFHDLSEILKLHVEGFHYLQKIPMF